MTENPYKPGTARHRAWNAGYAASFDDGMRIQAAVIQTINRRRAKDESNRGTTYFIASEPNLG
jgi:hypothetical protein